jgi:chromosome segregation ATPase
VEAQRSRDEREDLQQEIGALQKAVEEHVRHDAEVEARLKRDEEEGLRQEAEAQPLRAGVEEFRRTAEARLADAGEGLSATQSELAASEQALALLRERLATCF